MQRRWIQAGLQSNVVVRIAQSAELARHICHWGTLVNIKSIMPLMTRYGAYTIGPRLDHHLTNDLILLQHNFYTYNLLQTTHMTIHVSNQSNSIAKWFSCNNIYFSITIEQHINLWNLLLKRGWCHRHNLYTYN